MKFVSLSLPIAGFALRSVNAAECNSASVQTPTLSAEFQAGLDKFEASTVFTALKSKRSVLTCQYYETCIEASSKLICVNLNPIGDGQFHTEAGTYGSLLSGDYEVNRDDSLMNGQTLGNFLTGPYPVPTSTTASEGATDAPKPTSVSTSVDSVVAASTTAGAAPAATTKPSAAEKNGGQLLSCAVAAGAVIGYLIL